jgi:geranylgeranyl diphosphate synthase type II
MDPTHRIEQELETAVMRCEAGPPKLSEAIHYAVFPGGARIRPRLTLAVAKACGDANPQAANVAAAAIELLHCASLVHDDMPCFDNAGLRRGKPSVHLAYGESIALLTGDALVVLAFETLALRLAMTPDRLAPLTRIVASAIGAPHGIIAGQAWECEERRDIVEYQRAKTGSLFAACTMAGASAAGLDANMWRPLGLRIGEAFQVADDIRDVLGCEAKLGKPVGRDASLDRSNMVAEFGVDGAKERFESLLAAALEAIPPCPGQAELAAVISAVSKRMVTELGIALAA